ncbi:magnesium-dependent phosphatase 1-like isoform X2 [Chrysoperla carnea]|nr:magnesium-dependent phosphatase 1-like isoform X2 [Chrysoperla carnea]XP_044732036.1 magnesium-dependent phosphatase 1-like isoform X2 [Chrysoperla carnea]
MEKPKLIAFDLDYTLWPFWVDTHVRPPFRKTPEGAVKDSRDEKVKFYPEVPEVLKTLHQQGYILAVASRTPETAGANQLLKLFDWDKYFNYKEIYPGCKDKHFKQIQKNSGLQFSEMLFFDDEQRNIVDLSALGVTSILVDGGVTKDVVLQGLNKYRNEHCKK